MQLLSNTMEQIHTFKKYLAYYKEYKSKPPDKAFYEEYKFQTAISELKKSHSKLPTTKDILTKLDTLQEKKNTLMQWYSSTKTAMDELCQIRKNYGIYMCGKMEI